MHCCGSCKRSPLKLKRVKLNCEAYSKTNSKIMFIKCLAMNLNFTFKICVIQMKILKDAFKRFCLLAYLELIYFTIFEEVYMYINVGVYLFVYKYL